MSIDPSRDPAALRATAAEHYGAVKRFFRSKLPEPECYDRAQETLKAFLSVDPSRVENPRAFLMGIARKHLLKHYERQPATQSFDSTAMSALQLGTTLSAQIDRRNRLSNALRSIPLEEQVAFEWHYGEEMTIEQVAEQLGVSRATATRRISAAREKLRQLLDSHGSDLSDEEIDQLRQAYRSS